MDNNELLTKELQFFEVKTEKAESNDTEQTIVHYISTPDLDLGRDIMNPKGMISTDFEKFRTFFINHNYNLPAGKNLWLKTISEGVRAKSQFAKSVQWAVDYYNLHKEGVINTWSIGWDFVKDKNGKIKEGSVEMNTSKNIRTLHEWVLYEYSTAPLAMNPNALDQTKIAHIKSIVKDAGLQKDLEHMACELEIRNMIGEHTKEIIDLKALIESLPQAKEPDLTEIKSEIEKINKKLEKKTLEIAGPALSSAEIKAAVEKGRARAIRSLTGKKI